MEMVEELCQFVRLVALMRRGQHRYAVRQAGTTLAEVRKIERDVDQWVTHLLAGPIPLMTAPSQNASPVAPDVIPLPTSAEVGTARPGPTAVAGDQVEHQAVAADQLDQVEHQAVAADQLDQVEHQAVAADQLDQVEHQAGGRDQLDQVASDATPRRSRRRGGRVDEQ